MAFCTPDFPAVRPLHRQDRPTQQQPRGRCSAIGESSEGLCRDKVNVDKKAFVSQGETFKVTFLGKNGHTRVVDCPDDAYILDAAELAEIDLPATCRSGICGTCVGRVRRGEIDASDIEDINFTLTEEEVDDGMALLCMTRAKGDVSIEIQCDWGYSLGYSKWKGASGKFASKPDPLMGEIWNEDLQVEV